MTPKTLYVLSCLYFTMEVMTSMTFRSTNDYSELEIGFSTPRMPKNDTQHPLFTELPIFHCGGHDLYDRSTT